MAVSFRECFFDRSFSRFVFPTVEGVEKKTTTQVFSWPAAFKPSSSQRDEVFSLES